MNLWALCIVVPCPNVGTGCVLTCGWADKRRRGTTVSIGAWLQRTHAITSRDSECFSLTKHAHVYQHHSFIHSFIDSGHISDRHSCYNASALEVSHIVRYINLLTYLQRHKKAAHRHNWCGSHKLRPPMVKFSRDKILSCALLIFQSTADPDSR